MALCFSTDVEVLDSVGRATMLNPSDSEERRTSSRSTVHLPGRSRGGAPYGQRDRRRGGDDYDYARVSGRNDHGGVKDVRTSSGLPFVDSTDGARYLYWICLLSIVVLVILVGVGVMVAVVDYSETVELPDALALELNLQRAMYLGLRAHQFCVAEKTLQCTIDGLDPVACNATAAELNVLCPPVPELLQLVSTSGVSSALSESTSPTDSLFDSQVGELQGDSSSSPPPPSPLSV